MNKFYLFFIIIICLSSAIKAQKDTIFWFAAPYVTQQHTPLDGTAFRFTNTTTTAGTVTVKIAATNVTLATVAIPASGAASYSIPVRANVDIAADSIECIETDKVRNRGIIITSTVAITAYYEINNSHNCELFALKGKNALGTEFYIPFQSNTNLYNNVWATDPAKSTFDIVATENGTTVQIFNRVAVETARPANTVFSITLNKGQTYSCGFNGANYQLAANRPVGSVVLSDKPIAITIKEDSYHTIGGGCYDVVGDQIVPVDVIGTDYIVIKGKLTGSPNDEGYSILAIKNNTKIYVDGVATPVATLFAGQTYTKSNLTNARTYIHADNPVYCVQITGNGCELGSALLPPLNCAGSQAVSFVRSTSEEFYLNIMVKDGAQDGFVLTGGTAVINAADFAAVPGSPGWVSTNYTTSFPATGAGSIPVGTNVRLSNTKDVFGLGLLNGGTSSGFRYGFFSEFAARIFVEAGPNQTVCANNNVVTLNGSVTGGAIQGLWTTSGSGTFASATSLNTTYTPSATDITNGTVTLTLRSVSFCSAVTDFMVVTITPAPKAEAGADQTICKNNATVNLSGSINAYSTGATWSSLGTGTFADASLLTTTYIPSTLDKDNGSVKLKLTTTGNGLCNTNIDSMLITFTESPTANANIDQTVCANNSNVNLNGSITIATGGIWSGGSGAFNPNTTALGAVYSPTLTEIGNGLVTLTLTTTGIGNCNAVTDQMDIIITPAPTVDAGLPQSACKNNATVTLAGSKTIASGVVWSGGLGTFSNSTSLTSTYTPSAIELSNGSVTLTLTTTNSGNCNEVSDNVTITYTNIPIVTPGTDQTVCANNALISLSGTVSLPASGGTWTTSGTGTFANANQLITTYTPSTLDKDNGTVWLKLTSANNATCNPVTDSLKVTITPAPTANAGTNKTVCANNAVISLSGTITVASGATWTTNGDGVFGNANALITTYTPSSGDIGLGSITLTLTTTGNGTCIAASSSIVITITTAPTVDAGLPQSACKNNATVTLAGSKTIASGVIWSGGLGTFSNSTSLTSTYTPTATELSNGSATLILTTTGNGTCNAVSDNVTITYTNIPIVTPGANQTVCANNALVSLSGTVSLPASGGTWTTSGTGTFANANQLITTYTPSTLDKDNGTVWLKLTSANNATCNPVTDSLSVTITQSPSAEAGPNKSVCANNPNVTLNGSVIIATGGIWSGGTGTFNPSNTSLSAIYTPSIGEISAGTVTLTLTTTTGNGTCNAVSDNIIITITPSPIANAGLDKTVCANNSSVILGGIVTGATSGVWSGGLGVFNPNNTTLSATYTPSASEALSGSANLILTTTGNGTCNAESNNMEITITPAPTVIAGANQSVCANNANVSLSGLYSGSIGAVWSSNGTGSFAPNATSMNTTYIPSTADKTAGTVTLTLTSTGNGTCNPATNSLVVTITPAPTVEAGANQIVCANNPNVILAGVITGATGGVWTGGSGSFNPSNTSLGAIYTPSASEILAGTATLTLTTTGYGNCSAVSDFITIQITNAPTVFAGLDQSACKNNATVTLAGSKTIATGGSWSGGLGTFTPNNNTLTATYTPTATELSNGSVTLILTTTGNGSCTAVTDNMTIAYTNSPIVNAGANQSVCANNANVSLSGTVSLPATGGTWTKSGTGTFSPNANTLNATYIPSTADKTAETVTLYLTSTGNASCNPVLDSMIVSITPAPTANAGLDKTVCANNPSVTLNGTITVATGAIWTGGTGSFNPSNTSLSVIYTPSPIEIALGSASLTFTTTNNGNCNAVSDQINIQINPAPVVSAGLDRTVCTNNASLSLSGTITGATGGVWSGGLGTYNLDNTTLNAVYTPTPAEIAANNITLTLTSTGNGLCNAVSDIMILNFSAAPVVSAGADQTVGANNLSVTLAGSITGASGGTWTGGTGSYIPYNTALDATYTPSTAEITAGGANLTLISSGNGTCNPVSDVMHININPAPIVNAGTDLTSCANNPTVTLNGSITNASGGIWSGGTGIFIPSNTNVNATYTPSAAEITAGGVNITLTSTGNGSSNAVSDQVHITINAAPTANAGSDKTLCSNNSTVNLTGLVTLASGGQWSGGLGLFTPNNTTLTTAYSPTTTEINSGVLSLILTTTGNGTCLAVTDTMKVFFTTSPTINAGTDITSCGNNSNASLNGTVTIATGGVWSGGLGTFTPNNTSLNPTYTPTPAEIAAGGLNLTLTSTNNGNCNSVSDIVHITINPTPVVNAGSNIVSCVNNPAVTLAGSISNAASAIWSGSTGFYTPGNNSLTAVYTPSATEITAGSVILTLTVPASGTCLSVSDNMTIFFNPSPIINAGTNQTICSNNASIHLSGNVTNATGGQWSGGLGIYTPNSNTLNAIYTPTTTELAAGSITLTLTSTGNGACSPVSDNMLVTFTPSPTAYAGTDKGVCANNNQVTLNGNITISTGGTWSGGLGTYSPNNTTLNPIYTPTAAEIAAGSINLRLTTTGNGNCSSVFDEMHVNIVPSPIVNAGFDLTSCLNNPSVTLNGNIVNATGGQWTGLGTFNPSINLLNATYTPSAAEITAGIATLTLTSTGNGTCNAVSDQLNIVINPQPIVNAGGNQTVCANNPTVTLNGSVSLAAGGTWSGGLGVFSPNNSVLNATYTPTEAEAASGSVTLTLTSTGNGNCSPVTDQVTITYTSSPQVNAGLNQTVCANNSAITLDGAISVATGGIWSGGLGSFNPNNTTFNAVYNPTAAEIASGNVTLTLTSTGNGLCYSETDNVSINITASPIVNAGPNQTICVDDLNVDLNGFVAGITSTGQWTSNGTGVFVPNNTTLDATYIASSADSLAGLVTLTLASTFNGSCNFEDDELLVTILPTGVVNAGANQTVCGNNASVFLSGTVSGGATTGVWSTSGSGVFVPNNSALNAVYIPSQTDTAIGSVTLTLTANSCNLIQDQLLVTITNAPHVNAGVDKVVCVNNLNISLTGSISGGSTTGIWTSSGTGSFIPNNTTLNAVYKASAADSISQHVTLTLTATNYGNCLVVSDAMNISILPAGIVNAGFDQTYCANNANITLNGSLSGGASAGIWATSGTGTFDPNTTTLNAAYIPSLADISTGNVTLALTATNSCNYAMDILQINFTPAPTANAGVNQTLCKNNPIATLSGTVTVATGGTWTRSGTGTFASANNLNTTYTPSAADLATGSVFIYLTTTGNGGCNSTVDTMKITYSPSPSVNAGPDQHVCSSGIQTQLHGLVSGGATTGKWTTNGTGTFTPNDSTLNAFYVYSAADVTAGSVQLTLTSTNFGNCNTVSNSMNIIFGASAFAFAGDDIITCENNLNTSLDAYISGGSTTGRWTTSGTGTFVPNDSTLNATYICSVADSIIGNVELYLESTNNTGCLPGNDTLLINIERIPTIEAGSNQVICIGSGNVQLNGSLVNSNKAKWTSSGTGTFSPNDSTLTAQYIASLTDKTNGIVQLTLTTTDKIACTNLSDNITIAFDEPSVVNAGSDLIICENNLNVLLNGSITGGSTTVIWSGGTGVFTPSNTTLNATYAFSQTDSIIGYVNLVLSSTNNGGCSAKTDTIHITLDRIPIVEAGANQSICIGSNSIQLNGSITNATRAKWTTDGTGTFAPNDSTLTAQYIPSTADGLNGTIHLTLTSKGSIVCSNVSDMLTITIDRPSAVNTGLDIIVCESNLNIPLSGSVIGGSTTGIWSGGTGTFAPSNTTLSTTYTLSQTDSIIGYVKLVLTSTNNGGCPAANDTLRISLERKPIVNAGADQQICSGTNAITLNGTITNASGGVWTTNGSGTFSPSNNALNAVYLFSSTDSIAGTVELTLTSTGSTYCNAVSDVLNATLYVPLTVAFTNENACLNQPVQFTDNTTVSTGTITGYLWDFGNGNTSTLQNPTYSFSSIGTHQVTLLVNSSLGCSFSLTRTIIVNTPPIANFSNSLGCYKDDVIFTDLSTSSSGNIVSWGWNFSDGTTSTLQNPSHGFSIPGFFTVSLNITNEFGCSASVQKSVQVYDPPTANFNYTFDCSTNQVSFIGASTSSGVTLTNWQWNFGDGQLSNTENPNHTYTAAGIYQVQLIVGSSTNCSDTIVRDITIYSITAEFDYQNACSNANIPFIDQSIVGTSIISEILWNFDDGTTSTLQNPIHSFNISGQYEVQLIIRTTNGCVDTVKHTVIAYPVPNAAFTVDAIDYIPENAIQFNDASTGADSWQWDFGDNSGISTLQNLEHVYHQAGSYNVLLFVTNEYKCADSTMTQIQIIGEPEIYPPKVPNAFSPNGDGENDVYYVRGGPFTSLEFTIWNKWGQIIFETTDANKGWDGIWKGVEQPIGMYVYTIKATTVDGKQYSKSGDFTLIR